MKLPPCPVCGHRYTKGRFWPIRHSIKMRAQYRELNGTYFDSAEIAASVIKTYASGLRSTGREVHPKYEKWEK